MLVPEKILPCSITSAMLLITILMGEQMHAFITEPIAGLIPYKKGSRSFYRVLIPRPAE